MAWFLVVPAGVARQGGVSYSRSLENLNWYAGWFTVPVGIQFSQPRGEVSSGFVNLLCRDVLILFVKICDVLLR
jgi:hypothetical protein